MVKLVSVFHSQQQCLGTQCVSQYIASKWGINVFLLLHSVPDERCSSTNRPAECLQLCSPIVCDVPPVLLDECRVLQAYLPNFFASSAR